MFTLSDASRDTKEILKWGGIFFAILISVLLLIRLGFFIKELLYPSPPPKPTLSFGKLQQQSFPQNAVSQNLTYSINTLTGDVPSFPEQMKVYRIKLYQPDLLDLKNSEQAVDQAGFSPGYTKISDSVYQWSGISRTTAQLVKTIKMDIVSKKFTLTYPFTTDPEITSPPNEIDVDVAKNRVENMLSEMNLLFEDIDLTKTQTKLLLIKDSSVLPASSLSNAQLVEVDLYQMDLDKYPIYYEKPYPSNMSFLVGNRTEIVNGEFIHQSASEEFATYPIKSGSKALEELKSGKAYIASYFGTNTNISITNVFLAYYIGSQAQDFIMPIIVFEGNDGFFAYVPAVMDEWISK